MAKRDEVAMKYKLYRWNPTKGHGEWTQPNSVTVDGEQIKPAKGGVYELMQADVAELQGHGLTCTPQGKKE